MHLLAILFCAVAFLFLSATAQAAPLEGGVDPKRIAEIASQLPDDTFAFGPKITDRAAWDKLAHHPAFAKVIATAENKLRQPMPAMTEEIYSLYKTTGKRTKQYGDVRSDRHNRIAQFTLAECIENKGRFIAPLEAAIAEICTEPTWIYNFHDTPKLDDWHGQRVSVDLGAIEPAHEMASALVLLGDRLSPKTRQLITDECRRRILQPYHHAIENAGDSGMWWINAHMNWNAVCHFGVVGTALGIETDKQERAFFLASAEKFAGNYLSGFGPDGYCDEGMGYWNYGFSNYIGLAELVWQETDGKVNLYDLPNARAAAMYPAHIEIMNGLAPSFADCALNTPPMPRLAAFVNRRYRLGLPQFAMNDMTTASGGLPVALMYSSPNSATFQTDAGQAPAYELRTYFDHGGVVTCRPALGSTCRMGVSLKGGHNAEAHNHNDLGTFVIAIGKELPILDPGGEVYTIRTFGKDRYQSNLLNSFGHPVPVVAGQLQRAGREAQAKILTADFTDATDTFAMDISSAYAVPELKKLTRTFTYNRTGQGSLTVVDEVAFSKAEPFAGALITYGQWKQINDHTVVITAGEEAVEVTIDTGGVPFELKSETINEQTHNGDKPTRIGIDLKQPITAGKVTLSIKPVAKL